eukprot:jgi/Mesen1/4595/ME000232S03859
MGWRGAFLQAAKILANLIILGSGVVLRAVSQAYRQAIVNANKTGVAQEVVQNVQRRGSKAMTIQEARQILGVSDSTTWENVLESKVYRAKECLEAAHKAEQEAGGGKEGQEQQQQRQP